MPRAGRAVQFTPAALEALKAYRWPGNVRELGNLIERLSIQCQSRAGAHRGPAAALSSGRLDAGASQAGTRDADRHACRP